jgi:hypothetical protein
MLLKLRVAKKKKHLLTSTTDSKIRTKQFPGTSQRTPIPARKRSARTVQIRISRDDISTWRHCDDCDVYVECDEKLWRHWLSFHGR